MSQTAAEGMWFAVPVCHALACPKASVQDHFLIGGGLVHTCDELGVHFRPFQLLPIVLSVF